MDSVLLLTNPFHRLVFSRDGFPLPEYGPLFPLHSALAYIPIVLAIVLIYRFIIIKKPSLWFSIACTAVCVPTLVINVLFTVGLIIMEQDIAPYAFFCIFVIFAMYIYRSRLLNFKAAALSDIFESYRDVVIISDPAGIITDHNHAVHTYFPDMEIEGQHIPLAAFISYLEDHAAAGSPRRIWEESRKKDCSGEITVKTGGLEEQTFTLSIQKVKTRRSNAGHIIILSDVSAYHRMIEEINGQNKTLVELKDMAENASRAKSAFLATMSHEIRTPLNAILGLSDIQLQKKLPDDTLRDIRKIHNSGSDLLGIINDILDISKIEAGGFELIPVDYKTAWMVNATVQLNRVRIGSKPIGFELFIDETIPCKLNGDELRVKQIFNNLLSNAIKYTKEGTVSLSIKWKEDGDDAILICKVKDTGQGIKAEDIGKLFSEYNQLDTRANRLVEGTGLGLSITKNLAAMMGGKINVESEYGKGSTFTVSLRQTIVDRTPIGKEVASDLAAFRFRENSGAASESLVRSAIKGNVLVVDDVEINLEVAKGIMEPYGLIVDCAQSGKEAIEKIRLAASGAIAQYDIVFMDHMMPEMDGIETTYIIRSEIPDDYARNVPIIALTANALVGNEEMFLSNGFSGYISKPIDLVQLDGILAKWAGA
jgi:signal transduction histidine kinase/CheY-like chemotaxis protein